MLIYDSRQQLFVKWLFPSVTIKHVNKVVNTKLMATAQMTNILCEEKPKMAKSRLRSMVTKR